VFAVEGARQGLIRSLSDNALSHPLPKLRLRRPELLAVATDDKRRFLFFLFLLSFTGAHYHTVQ